MGRERTVISKAHGFGLIEMLVTLSLVAILATVAVPSFQHLINETRVMSEANSLVDALYSARSYAARNDTDATFCAGTGCGTSDGLAAGWLIRDNSGKTIRTWPAPGTTMKSFFGSSSLKSITYGADGLPAGHPNGHVNICAGAQARQVVLSFFGRVRTQSVNGGCPSCECALEGS